MYQGTAALLALYAFCFKCGFIHDKNDKRNLGEIRQNRLSLSRYATVSLRCWQQFNAAIMCGPPAAHLIRLAGSTHSPQGEVEGGCGICAL